MQRFLTNFFVQFLVELDVISTCSVAFCCLLHTALSCVVLCCAVTWRDVTMLRCYDVVICLLLVTLVCWLKISQFSCSFVARLDGRTTVRPAQGPNIKQNFHCVFSTGKHRFLRGIFVIVTTVTELNNALRMFVTSLLSSSLVPRAAILTVSAMDRSSGLWNVNELLNESVSC